MTVELWILLKATAALALGLTAATLIRRARASVRHVVLASTFGALLALPIVATVAPAMVVRVPIARGAGAVVPFLDRSVPVAVPQQARVAEDDAIQPARGHSLSTTTALRIVWAVGAACLLTMLGGSLWRLRRIRRDGIPWIAGQATALALAPGAGVRRAVTVLLHEAVAAPVTCGLGQPAIVLPPDAREWSESDLRRAFIHELEHVRRGDWAMQLVARAICGAYWFHPLVWIAWRRLRLESERACDDAVVSDVERTDYADQLVMLAERLSRGRIQPVLAMASRSDLSVRVTALLDRTQLRGRAGAAVVTATALAAAVFVALIAPVRAVAVSLEPDAAAVVQQAMHVNAATKALNIALVEAADRGDLASVTELLNSGADVNAVVAGDGSPLIVAARGGHTKIVFFLLERSADPNLAVRGDGNPLIMAARGGHADIVTALLDRGASIDEIVPDDENALIQASDQGRLDMVKLLVSRGANVNARAWAAEAREREGGEWRTPLSMARKNRHDAVARYLVSVGAVE